jgi:hypothetical protein
VGGLPNILMALAIVFGGLWFFRKMGNTPANAVPALTKRYAGYGLVAFSVVLALRGNLNTALPLFAFGLALVGIASPFGQSFGWPGSKSQDQNHQVPERAGAKMTASEALAVLGLRQGASSDEIKAAHRRLMKELHPDKGGSEYLAVKVNQAKDVLLG